MFIKTAFNPDSWLMKCWQSFVQFLGIYYFIVIPVRIAFDPWRNMLDIRAFCTDLIADALTALNLAVAMNTCYTNSRAAIITDRMKILRRINYNIGVAAFPLDW